jgi:restriction endonuclease Mrr
VITYIDKQQFGLMQSLDDVFSLSPKAFEYFSKFLLEGLGYTNVQVSKKHGDHGADGGIDIFAKQDEERVLGQCKKWTKGRAGYMPVEQVRALGGSMKEHDADKGVFISTLPFSETTRRYAERVNICLIGPYEIEQVITRNNKKPAPIHATNREPMYERAASRGHYHPKKKRLGFRILRAIFVTIVILGIIGAFIEN